MALLILILLMVGPMFESEASTTTLALVISSIALVLSLFGFMLKWISTPLSNSYARDICEFNANEISKKHGLPNDLLLLALIKMKYTRSSVLLTDLYSLSSQPFEKEYLLKKLYE